MKQFGKVALLSTAIALAPAIAVSAATFKADLKPLNNSGVSGTALLELLEDKNLLKVTINATGLEPNMLHPQHIHGRFADSGSDFNGEAIDSVTPPPSADTDGDGFIEVGEGLPFYGPIILPLSSPPAESPSGQSFPTAPNGTISFTQTYDLSKDSLFFDPIAGIDFTSEDLFPLVNREIVLHGMTVPAGVGEGTGGAVNGSGGYIATLPVAAGEIQAVPESVPEPAATLGLLSLGGLAFLRRRRVHNA
ncbi:MAG: PEP-CTERM sorting domain-containing protein [Cyanobacteriota bacterium]